MSGISTAGGHIAQSDNVRPARRCHWRRIEALKLERSSQFLSLEASITFISKPHDDVPNLLLAPYKPSRPRLRRWAATDRPALLHKRHRHEDKLYIALDLARDDPLAFNSLIGIGLAHFQVGRYVEATHWLQRGIAEHPAAVWAYQVLCASHMLCGQKTEARRRLAELRCRYPYLTIERATTGFSFLPRVSCESLADGLEAAGLPH
jgi:hypothetical protein